MSVAGLQPLGRPSSSAGCCDSSRQQQAAGPGPPSGLPLSGTSCVCGQQPLLPLLASSVLSPLPSFPPSQDPLLLCTLLSGNRDTFCCPIVLSLQENFEFSLWLSEVWLKNPHFIVSIDAVFLATWQILVQYSLAFQLWFGSPTSEKSIWVCQLVRWLTFFTSCFGSQTFCVGQIACWRLFTGNSCLSFYVALILRVVRLNLSVYLYARN